MDDMDIDQTGVPSYEEMMRTTEPLNDVQKQQWIIDNFENVENFRRIYNDELGDAIDEEERRLEQEQRQQQWQQQQQQEQQEQQQQFMNKKIARYQMISNRLGWRAYRNIGITNLKAAADWTDDNADVAADIARGTWASLDIAAKAWWDNYSEANWNKENLQSWGGKRKRRRSKNKSRGRKKKTRSRRKQKTKGGRKKKTRGRRTRTTKRGRK